MSRTRGGPAVAICCLLAAPVAVAQESEAATGEQQLFPSIQPAIRWSRLEPDFVVGGPFLGPSVRREWTKIDHGVRLGIVGGTDLMLEFQDNEMTLARGAKISNDELFSTLRWRVR